MFIPLTWRRFFHRKITFARESAAFKEKCGADFASAKLDQPRHDGARSWPAASVRINMYLFKRRSLTAAIDSEIHRIVRRNAPGRYWTFRSTDWLARAAFAFALVTLVLYLGNHVFARMAGALSEPEFATAVNGYASMIAVFLVISVISNLVRDILFKDLERIARDALPQLLSKPH